MDYGFGRIAAPDPRDLDYLLHKAIPQQTDITYRYWNAEGWWGNQGNTPKCVAYTWLHWLEDGPVTHKRTPHGGSMPLHDPNDVYVEARKIDKIPDNVDGATIRGGAKVLQRLGHITTYSWSYDVETTARAIATTGPVVAGTVWTRDMFEPNDKGFLIPTGRAVSGHAYLLNGVNIREEKLRKKGSWGRDWGDNGGAWMSFDHFQWLLSRGGEVCLPTEIPSNN